MYLLYKRLLSTYPYLSACKGEKVGWKGSSGLGCCSRSQPHCLHSGLERMKELQALLLSEHVLVSLRPDQTQALQHSPIYQQLPLVLKALSIPYFCIWNFAPKSCSETLTALCDTLRCWESRKFFTLHMFTRIEGSSRRKHCCEVRAENCYIITLLTDAGFMLLAAEISITLKLCKEGRFSH